MKFFLLALSLLFLVACDSASVMTDSEPDDDGMGMVLSTTSRSGSFSPLNGKETNGQAILEVVSDGVLKLDFSSNFSLTEGPGLFVMLSNSEFPSDDAINLGSFVSPNGAQSYSIPSGVTLDSFTHVVIHCVPYDVTFAFAELK